MQKSKLSKTGPSKLALRSEKRFRERRAERLRCDMQRWPWPSELPSGQLLFDLHVEAQSVERYGED